jgi:uridine kinase
MIGDKLVITNYHRKAARKILTAIQHKLAAGASCVTVSIGGESGSGKSEVANCLAATLEESGKACLILCQDDYFRLPPKSNHQKRKTDISWVGLGEVRLDLMEAHIYALKEHPERPLSKPLVEFEEDRIGCEIIERGIRDVVIIEGCYTTLLSNVDVRAFINRSYIQTKKSRKTRARDPSDVFLERVLRIEHKEIASHKRLANIVIEAPPAERKAKNGAKNSTKTATTTSQTSKTAKRQPAASRRK